MWKVWDKKSDINGCSAESYLNRNKCLANEETIFLKIEDGRVLHTEGKSILARIYEIDPSLSNEEFIAEYKKIIGEPVEEEEPTEPTEPEPDETATYAELAQVYKEGVNGLE